MNDSFTYQFHSSQPPTEVYKRLLDVRQWWFGLYDEHIVGSSDKINDEFRFVAGSDAHDTTQRIIELIPNKKIVWLVTSSHLSFLQQPDEWTNTTLRFELITSGNTTQVIFTHEGLLPEIECYDVCSNAWSLYLKRLQEVLS